MVLNGADPEIKEGLIPVVIYSDGSVKKADIYKEWYNYTNKHWANAVTLKDKTKTYLNNEVIPSENIDGYFVWIPRYRYEIFNEGNYTNYNTVSSKPTESNAKEINIVFESKNVTPSTGNTVDSWLTHPAFTTLDVNGIWVGKYETSGSTSDSDINVIPNVESLRNINVKTMFKLAYNYNRNLDSHMMKNTEWGAVAYLSHSKYGRCNNEVCEEVRINNSSTYITGCAASVENGSYYSGCENEYNTLIGVFASTTGNITGIYDMSGGSWEYMASYVENSYGNSGFNATSIASYDNKYFDIYSSDSTIVSYNNKILGDATGEMGPFYGYTDSDNRTIRISLWYSDLSHFIDPYYSWFSRGGYYGYQDIAGIFHFDRYTGEAYGNSFRLVLS